MSANPRVARPKSQQQPHSFSVYFRAFSGNCLSKINEICEICGHLFLTNKPNFKIPEITLSPYFLKTKASNFKSVLDKNEPKRTHFEHWI